MKSLYYSHAVQAQLFEGTQMPISQPVLWLAIHSEDPSGQDSQAHKEVAGLARASVPRGVNAWAANGMYWANAQPIHFEPATANGIGRYWTLGLEPSGAAPWLISGKLTDPVTLELGVKLCVPAQMLTSEEI